MRRLITLKSSTDTESMGVNVAGISTKVFAHYPGRSQGLFEKKKLSMLRSIEKSPEKSAEVILRLPTTAEGPNLKLRSRPLIMRAPRDIEGKVEMPRAHRMSSGRKSRGVL